MRKNKMMRTAAVLGVAAMLTTCALSGTLAKYTTTAEAQDSARVAKWGVRITMADDDSIFKSVYAKNTTNEDITEITNTVEASNYTAENNGDKVVAPGTTGETTFSIKGKPEVAFKLNVAVNSTSTIKVAANNEYILAPGKFEDTEVKVKPTKDYEPIVFELQKEVNDKFETVKKKPQNKGAEANDAKNMTLAELKSELEALSTLYKPNVEVDDTYKIVWSWPMTTAFSDYDKSDGHKAYNDADVLDTYLGNQENNDIQKETYKITITATQID